MNGDRRARLHRALDAVLDSFEDRVRKAKSMPFEEGEISSRGFLPITKKDVLSNNGRKYKAKIPLNKVVGFQDYLNREQLLAMMKVPLSRLQEPVPVVLKGSRYYLLDGHHRAAVLKARGQTTINAEVEEQ